MNTGHLLGILDYPTLTRNAIVVWYWNDVQWPDGRRQTKFLARKEYWRYDRPIWSMEDSRAWVFDTIEEGVTALNEARHLKSVAGFHVSTIGDLIRLVGYPEGGRFAL